ncbi:MAG: AGE family epimerase/isomerase [Bacteroidales bacterium]|nr:AGE family epimerase/isomerase [Bacteroidales bacterium]
MPDHQEMLQYRQSFENELFSILNYWQTYAPEPNSDGFYGAVDMHNTPVPDAPKSCVLNARILWTFSAAAKMYPDRSYGEMAAKSYRVLDENFRDHTSGGYYMELNARNEVSDDVKHTYAQAFVLYALSKYYDFLPDDEVHRKIADYFVFLDGQTKDPVNMGYLEAFTRDWEPITENRMADNNEPKSMNTHLHVLEAYAAVYKVLPNALVKLRLVELIYLFLHHIIRDDGHLGIFFDENFVETNESRAICSYGHDIEASWLLWEALEILGDEQLKEEAKPVLLKMADAVFREGLDQDGGLFLESSRFGSHIRTNKHWWLQAEVLVGEMNAFELSGDQKYWNLLKHSWNFVNKHVIDHENGEWFTKLNRLGVPYLVEPEDDPSPYYRNDWKIDPWKCPYHNGRAMMELIGSLNKRMKKT